MNAGSCGKEETVGSGRGGGEEEKRLGRPKARRRGEEGHAYSLMPPHNVEVPSDTMGLSCTPPPSQLCKRVHPTQVLLLLHMWNGVCVLCVLCVGVCVCEPNPHFAVGQWCKSNLGRGCFKVTMAQPFCDFSVTFDNPWGPLGRYYVIIW